MKINSIIFFVSLLFYCSIGLLFSLNTQIVFHPKYTYDLFLGYDNLLHVTSFFRHPLLVVFPLLGDYLQSIFSPKTISIGITIFCGFLLSLQNVFMFIFSKRTLQLTQNKAIISIALFSCFAPNLINSFTFDSFIISGFLLSIFWIYYFSKPKSHIQLLILGTLITGVTITNGAKVWISFLYQKKSKFLNSLSVIGFFSLLALFFVLSKKIDFLTIINYHAYNYTDGLKNSWTNFLGGVFILPETVAYTSRYNDVSKSINFVGAQSNLVGYFLVSFCIILMIISFYKNRKSEIIKILGSVFLLDIFIHVILGYGLQESFIYASHYQFLFYVLSALLIKVYFRNWYFKTLILLWIGLLLSYNLYQLHTLYSFAKLYYSQL